MHKLWQERMDDYDPNQTGSCFFYDRSPSLFCLCSHSPGWQQNKGRKDLPDRRQRYPSRQQWRWSRCNTHRRQHGSVLCRCRWSCQWWRGRLVQIQSSWGRYYPWSGGRGRIRLFRNLLQQLQAHSGQLHQIPLWQDQIRRRPKNRRRSYCHPDCKAGFWRRRRYERRACPRKPVLGFWQSKGRCMGWRWICQIFPGPVISEWLPRNASWRRKLYFVRI